MELLQAAGTSGLWFGASAAHVRLELPIVSIIVPFWGYLLGSLVQNWLNQKRELPMETTGRILRQFWAGVLPPAPSAGRRGGVQDSDLDI